MKNMKNIKNTMGTFKGKKEVIITIDYNMLPSEYKLDTVKESIDKYKKDFGIEAIIIPIDSSKKNLEDGTIIFPEIHKI